MSDATQKFDLVVAGDKRLFALSWQACTAADLTAILTGYAALTSSGTYTDHHGTSYTVKQNDLEPVTYDEVSAANANRYNVSLTLREV